MEVVGGKVRLLLSNSRTSGLVNDLVPEIGIG